MKIIIVLSILILFGCGKNYYPKTDDAECKEYFKLIKNDWKQREDSTFYFKAINYYDEVFETDRYAKMGCVKGLSEKEVKFLFGEPSEAMSFEDTNSKLLTYFLAPLNSTSEGKVKDIKLVISFGGNEKVSHLYFTPSPPDK